MALVLTETKSSGFTEGWHTVTVRNATAGNYNGTQYIDMNFDNYPDSLKCRVWATRNSDGEEFSIANLIRYSNPNILEEMESSGGKGVAKVDDSPASLNGKSFQALFTRNKDNYIEVSQKLAPGVPFKNIIDDMTEERINGIKQSAEKWEEKRTANLSTTPNGATTTEPIPF